MSDLSVILEKLQHSPLVKHWERDYCPFFSSMAASAHLIANKPSLGDGAMSLALFTHHKGICSYYRLEEENKRFFDLIRNKHAQSSSISEEIRSSYERAGDALVSMNERIHSIHEFSLDFLRGFVEQWTTLIAYQLFVHRMIDFLTDDPKEQILAGQFTQLRVKYEILFGSFEKIFDELCLKLTDQYDLGDHQLLKLLTPEEFFVFLELDVIPDDIDLRKKEVVVSALPDLKMYTEDRSKAIFKVIEENLSRKEKALIDQQDIRGMVVEGLGVLKGRAQVVKDFSQLSEVEDGVILVVSSTLPRYETYYRKARAIITDEGGILSHVAIFCREAKKPAIIGTKIATRVISTGMQIELDFTTGIVQII